MQMLRRIQISLYFFLAVCQTVTADWKIHNYEGFSELVSQETELLNTLLDQGDTLAISSSKELLITSPDELSSLWARINLVSVLIYFEKYEQAENQLGIVQNAIIGRDIGELRAYYLLHSGSVAHLKAEYSKSDSIYRSLSSDEFAQQDRLKAILAKDQAHNMRYLGDYETSQIKWYEALNYYQKNNDSTGIIQCLQGIGIIKYLIGDFEMAKENFDTSLSYWKARANQKEEAFGYNLLGLWHFGKKEFTRSIELCTKSYQIRKQNNDLRGEGESLNNLALAYAGLENWNQALKYFRLSLQKLILGKDLRQVPTLQFNIGRILAKQGNTSEAEQYLLRGLGRALELKQVRSQMNGYANLSDLYEEKGDESLALSYHKKLLALKDSSMKVEKSRALEELEVRYMSEQKQQEIELLQRDKKISANRWLTLALGLFAVIIIAVLIIDGQRRRMNQSAQLHLTKNELVEAELKNTKLELGYNQNKLTVYMDNLIRKNDMVQDLEERVKLFNDGQNNDKPEAKELFSELANSRILTEEDWDQFRNLFNEAHEGFIPKLMQAHPHLTSAEQRLFLLMRLQLPTKQIALILGVSPDSVKKGRYRLKRKIGLEDLIPLQSFVSNFT
ncbi:MAG: tetratricopeptide (TPR) repeat protein [Granulosicoccus sp.]|jgi:tetratricopeptide (TPR) repeat protein